MLRTFVKILFLPATEPPLVAVRREQLYGTAGDSDRL
ncbi:hypothetical protein EV281_10295 [Rhizobium sp. BK418]|nr:hypothetical protein EV281_10295 [Rhizobium sp. BK418]